GASLATALATAASDEEGCLAAVMRPIEYVGASLAVVWRIHVPWMLVAILAGALAAAASGRESRRAAWRTVWTAQASLAVSTMLFANITLAAWDALFTALRRTIREDALYSPVALWPSLVRLLCLPPSPLSVGDYITR